MIGYPIKSIYKELGMTLLVILLIYWLVPLSLWSFFDAVRGIDGILFNGLRNIAGILANYAFYGSVLIVVSMYCPKVGWQLGITFVFCHTAIDLVRDNFPNAVVDSPYIARSIIVFMTFLVALLTAYFRRRKKGIVQSMLLLLVWSTMIVSYLWLIMPDRLIITGMSLSEIIIGKLIGDIAFTIAAIIVSWIVVKKIRFVY